MAKAESGNFSNKFRTSHDRGVTQGVRIETARDQLKELRKKLLDLSNRNRFLNFRHSDRSRKQLRLIADSLEHIYSLVRRDEKVSVRPIPEIHDETLQFEELVAGADLTTTSDAEVPSQQDDVPEKRLAKERAARDQERLSDLLRAAAVAHDIDPSFLLPVASSEDDNGKYFQALHFQEALERKLSGLRDDFRSILQELGINTLYCAIGFLDWYESEASEKQLVSPLLLHPIGLDRTLERGRYRYKVIGTSEDTEVNVTLSERLTSDFGIKLPAFEPGEAPDPITKYFAEVQQLIKDKPKWRIRSYATLGIFNFSRLAMHKDLDPAIRSEANALHMHSIVADLLGGIDEDKGLSSEIYAVDEPQFLKAAPLMIKDADPSQFSAIVDVLRGRSLVISGPPGTGKSQTITNLIAGALASGKTVLFMAEKLAALQVVKSRLDGGGLGDFCLELHSTQSRRAAVLESIRRRIFAPKDVKATLSSELARLEHYKGELRSYIDALNSPFGERGKTVHELIWAAQAAETKLADEWRLRLKDLDLREAHKYDDAAFEALLRSVDAFSSILSQITSEFGSPSAHPWCGIKGKSLNAESARLILRHLREAAQALRVLSNLTDEIRLALGYSGDVSVSSLSELVALHEVLGDSQFLFPADIVTKLCAEPYHSVVAKFVTELREFEERKAEWKRLHQATDWNVVVAEGAAFQVAIHDYIQRYGESHTVGSLEAVKTKLASDATLFARGGKLVRSILERLSVADANAEVCHKLLCAVDLLANTDRAALLARSTELTKADRHQILRKAKVRAEGLKAAQARLRDRFVIDDSLSVGEVLECERQFRSRHMLSFISADYRRAKKLYRSIARDTRKASAEECAAACRELADYLEASLEFEADKTLISISGHLWNSRNSDFDTMVAITQYATDIRRLFQACGTEASNLTQHFVGPDDVEVDWLRSVGSDPTVRAILDLTDVESHCASLDQRSTEASVAVAEIAVLIRTLRRLSMGDGILMADVLNAAETAQRLMSLADNISQNQTAQAALGSVFDSTETKATLVEAHLKIAEGIRYLSLSPTLRDAIAASTTETRKELIPKLILARQEVRALGEALNSAAAVGLEPYDFFRKETWRDDTAETVRQRIDLTLKHADSATEWFRYQQTREALQARLRNPELLLLVEMNPTIDAVAAVTSVFCASAVRAAYTKRPVLEQYSGDDLSETRARFADLDLRLLGLHAKRLRAELLARAVDEGNRIGPKSAYTDKALLMHEAGKSKRYISIRELTRRAGRALQGLKPCFMMSPLSVAQFLSPGSVHFDLIIIDEASQMRPEDAIGALSRGSQVVIVGDAKQLPPTSFFDRIDQTEDESDEDADDSESILDLALKQYHPPRSLMWHYRSRHESLIAFSNHHFYNDELIVFPSPHKRSESQGVTVKYVSGKYRSSVNVIEAQAVANAAVLFMRTNPTLSLGIVAMNQPQRDHILAEVERLMAGDQSAADYEAYWSQRLEPFFVKNLETVQGDERDVILISTVYGPDERGSVMQRFGPINARNGWRRLNVLFTRAKHSVQVFTSMRPGDIIVDGATSRGARSLRDYIEYAESGRLDGGTDSGREPDSDFELAVASVLRDHGYEVSAQVGVAGYFIDMAVKDPYSSGYVIGIECDGAMYHRAKSARDRDRIREERLKSLGWRLHRIWSTDWFANPRREIEKLISRIEREIGEAKELGRTRTVDVSDDGEGSNRVFEFQAHPSDSMGVDDSNESSEPAVDIDVPALEPPQRVTEAYRANRESLVARLTRESLDPIDNRDKRGALWVVGDHMLAPFFEKLSAEGIKFVYAQSGGRATNFKPGWFTKSEA